MSVKAGLLQAATLVVLIGCQATVIGLETSAPVEGVARARSWLLGQQAEDGSFRSRGENGVPTIPLTAMALWALSVTGPDATGGDDSHCRAAAQFLIDEQRENGSLCAGGIGAGLTESTSAIALRALTAWRECGGNEERLAPALERLTHYLATDRPIESIDTPRRAIHHGEAAAEVIDTLLEDAELTAEEKRALEFLERARRSRGSGKAGTHPAPATGTNETTRGLTYAQLLRHVGDPLEVGSPEVLRVCSALRACYTLETNPGLTVATGGDSARSTDAGLYYYYLLLARTLGTVGSPRFETADGVAHDWTTELSHRRIDLQRDEGFWQNENGRWWEDEPILVTSYALIALSLCQRVASSSKESSAPTKETR